MRIFREFGVILGRVVSSIVGFLIMSLLLLVVYILILMCLVLLLKVIVIVLMVNFFLSGVLRGVRLFGLLIDGGMNIFVICVVRLFKILFI